MDLSVVIASHNQPVGQYLTTFSAIQQLEDSGLDWEIVIAADGGEPTKWENQPRVRCLRFHGGSPQHTRDIGIRSALAPSALVIEDHVVVSDIQALLEVHKRLGAAISVPRRVGETSEMFTSYGYEGDWDHSFWVKKTYYTPKSQEPYPIIGFGHAAFMVDVDWYKKAGGYFLEMEEFGGEEPDLNLLVWHTGRETWMIPSIWHAHFLTPGAHGNVYGSENFKRNFCMAAYEHGGNEYLEKVESQFQYRLQKTPGLEARRQLICQGPFKGDLKLLISQVQK